MHDEDCKYGLNVTNRDGKAWRAYGDSRWSDPQNAASRAITQSCVQTSVDEVYAAFAAAEGLEIGGEKAKAERTVKSSDAGTFGAWKCIPTALPAGNSGNYYPLFSWDGNMLWRRDEISKLWSSKQKKHGGISGWWSTTTLVELKEWYGPPSGLPPPPNSTALSELMKAEATEYHDVGRASLNSIATQERRRPITVM
jgi:hypothetical protein